MKIEVLRIEDLKPAPYNPRVELVPGMEEYEKLKQSIIEFGFVEPVIFNKSSGYVVGGHQRLSVAKDLGYKEVDVSIVELSDEKEKVLNIALNKISGSWDDKKLHELLSELGTESIELTGFDESEFDELMKSFTELSDNELGDFDNQEIDIDDYSDSEFDCKCPKCGFLFNNEVK